MEKNPDVHKLILKIQESYKEMILNNKKKWIADTCRNIDEPRKYYNKWKKLAIKEISRKAKLLRQKADEGFPGTEDGSRTFSRKLFGVLAEFWNSIVMMTIQTMWAY